MKYKKYLKNLEARKKAWEDRKGKNANSGHAHMKPGSEKK